MHLAVENLEARLLFALDPSAREQEMLEMLNRFRGNPAAELNLLIHSTDTHVNDALSFFNVDLKVLASQWSKLTPAPPLAWNAALQ